MDAAACRRRAPRNAWPHVVWPGDPPLAAAGSPARLRPRRRPQPPPRRRYGRSLLLERLQHRIAVAVERQLLHAKLHLTQLLRAVRAKAGATLVGLDRTLQIELAALELLHDGFELGQSFLEAHLGNRLGRCTRVGA